MCWDAQHRQACASRSPLGQSAAVGLVFICEEDLDANLFESESSNVSLECCRIGADRHEFGDVRHRVSSPQTIPDAAVAITARMTERRQNGRPFRWTQTPLRSIRLR